jgi:hypothetical protein
MDATAWCAMICSRERSDGLSSTSISKSMHSFGVFIGLGGAGAPADPGHVRHLGGQGFRQRAHAVGFD